MAAAGRQRRSEEKEEEVVTEDDVGVASTRDERTVRWWVKMGM